MHRFLFLVVLLSSMFLSAAIPVHQATTEKKNKYLDSGVFVGGFDQGPLVLLNVRHGTQPDQGLERLVFDIGRIDSEKSVERPGFFHISVQKKPHRIIIDLQNIQKAKVTQENIARALSKSKFFSKAQFYLDASSKDLTIEMPLKANAKIEVFELVAEGKPGRIVIDVKKP